MAAAIHDLAHAELLALLSLDRGMHDPEDCALYITLEPCPMCLGALVMANVRELHYACRDPWAGDVNLLGTTPYLKRQRRKLRVHRPGDADLERVVAALAVEHSYREKGKPNVVAGALAEVYPHAAAVGERLFDSGLILQLRDSKAEEGVNEVNRLLGETGRGTRGQPLSP